MRRSLLLAAAGLFLAVGLTRAQDPAPPAGYWKLSVPLGDEGDLLLMVAFTQQDGKWVGDYLTSNKQLRAQPTFKTLTIDGDHVRFDMDFAGRDFVSFDGKLSADKKVIRGSMSFAGQPLQLAELHPSKLRRLDDPFEVARETLAQVEGGEKLFDAAAAVLSKAGEKKLPAEEVQQIVQRVDEAAAKYGPRWERQTALRVAQALAGQEKFADTAVAQAKRAEKLLSDADPPATRMQVLQAVADALAKAGKADEAKTYAAKIADLEAADLAEYEKTLPFKPEAFAGRKAKSDRGVLVEVFTGAECPPCAAVDLAFDGLLKTYKPADVVLLQYHVHIPGPDPLTSPDSLKRAFEYYGMQIEGTPTVFVDGKVAAPGGGSASAAGEKYSQLRKAIDAALEQPAGARLTLTVGKAEKGGFTAKASVADLANPGEKMTLRFALAEEVVRYTGGNGLRYHHMVVRSMPGGVQGFPLKDKAAEQSVTFDPAALRKELAQSLAEFEKTEQPFPRPDKPLNLKNLKLVAFVQNDATREVLDAVQVDVP
jgi:hypothetical protein